MAASKVGRGSMGLYVHVGLYIRVEGLIIIIIIIIIINYYRD
jgi:hypothetical protein